MCSKPLISQSIGATTISGEKLKEDKSIERTKKAHFKPTSDDLAHIYKFITPLGDREIELLTLFLHVGVKGHE